MHTVSMFSGFFLYPFASWPVIYMAELFVYSISRDFHMFLSANLFLHLAGSLSPGSIRVTCYIV